MNLHDFEKEAGMADMFKNLRNFNFLGGANAAGREAVKKVKEVADDIGATPRQGKMVRDPLTDTGVKNPGDVRFYDQDEIRKHMRDASDLDGTGSFVGDIGIGAINLLTPKSWGLADKLNEGSFKMKRGFEKLDTKAGEYLAGDDPTSFRGRIFSSPTGRNGQGIRVGEKTNPDGSVSPIMEGTDVDQRPSLLAPVVNSYKLLTPFLATAFVADKFFPQQPNPQAVNQAPPMQQTASHLDWADAMDKQASLTKIAQLEEEVLEKQAAIEQLIDENRLLQKQAMDVQKKEREIKRSFDHYKQDTMMKKAEHEEFRLRTVARERSQHAVKLAEEMLENGMIKQADFNKHVDRLMECDADTFELQANLVKEATKNKEGLESLSFLSDYYSNDNPFSRPTRGLSKTGQTIGEAARELRK